jgi:hypothetical protein
VTEDLAGDQAPPKGLGRNWNTRDAGFGRTVRCSYNCTHRREMVIRRISRENLYLMIGLVENAMDRLDVLPTRLGLG